MDWAALLGGPRRLEIPFFHQAALLLPGQSAVTLQTRSTFTDELGPCKFFSLSLKSL